MSQTPGGSPKFQARIEQFEMLRELPGAWSAADYTAILEAVEYGDSSGLSDGELFEFALLSLQDMEPDDAAEVLLRLHLGDTLNGGQIQNFAHEMQDEKLWEESGDMRLHERMFHIGSLLHQAAPGLFPEPDAVQVTLIINADNQAARDILAAPLPESLVVRMLAGGMDDSAALRRRFEEQLAGTPFPEAEHIVWTVQTESGPDNSIRLKAVGSGYWLDALRETHSWEFSASTNSSDEVAQAR